MLGTIKRALAMGVCICAFFVFVSFANAASITPESVSVQLYAGEQVDIQIGIFNDAQVSKIYDISLKQAKITGEVGDVIFTEPGILSSWVRTEFSQMELASNQAGIAQLSISVPEDTRDGVYILGVQFKERPGEAGGIGTQTAFMSLVFIEVGDSLTQDAELLDFQISSTVHSHLPVQFFATIRNEGQAICIPSGVVAVKSVFGNIVEVVPFNFGGNRVLAGQSRTISGQWGSGSVENGFWRELKQEASDLTIGIFKIEPEILLFEGVVVEPEGQWIVVFPWRLSIIVFSILFFALGLLWWLRQRV